MIKASHRKQHFVAKSYLKAWTDPNTPENHEPYVWSFPVEGGAPTNRPPVKLLWEPEMYTRFGEGGERDLGIEMALQRLETAFGVARKNYVENRAKLPPRELAVFMAFVAAQKFRTPAAREHMRATWEPVIDRIDQMKRGLDKMTPEQRKRAASVRSISSGPSMSEDQVRKLAEQPLQKLLLPTVKSLVPHLTRFSAAFLTTTDETGFITSDDPCVWFDPAAHQRPPMHRAPALMYKTLEITLPISPDCLLLLNKKGVEGYFEIPLADVDEINRRTRAFADKVFISRSAEAKPFWYERGEAPSEDELGPSILG